MLNFWYSPRCTPEMKWGICIVVCICIYFSSMVQQLPTKYTVIALALGLAIHALRHVLHPTVKQKPMLKVIFYAVLAMSFTLLIYSLPQDNRLIFAIQSLGFVSLGLCLVSNHVQRAKRE